MFCKHQIPNTDGLHWVCCGKRRHIAQDFCHVLSLATPLAGAVTPESLQAQWSSVGASSNRRAL